MKLEPWEWLLKREKDVLQKAFKSKKDTGELWHEYLTECQFDERYIKEFREELKKVLYAKIGEK